ncbi:MAG: hypothetical protein WB949_00765 [Candidatus Acidiferrales bacterium]
MDTRKSLKPSRYTSRRVVRVRLYKKRQPWATGVKAERLAALEARAFQWITRGHAANVELGRVFLEIKEIVGRGRWELYFKERFGSSGIAARTARTYMKMASKEKAKTAAAESAVFAMAADRQAVEIREATDRAQAELGLPSDHKFRKEDVRLEGPSIYRLSLHLTGDQRCACDELRKLPAWPEAEQRIINLLKRLWFEYGLLNEHSLDGPVNQ